MHPDREEYSYGDIEPVIVTLDLIPVGPINVTGEMDVRVYTAGCDWPAQWDIEICDTDDKWRHVDDVAIRERILSLIETRRPDRFNDIWDTVGAES